MRIKNIMNYALFCFLCLAAFQVNAANLRLNFEWPAEDFEVDAGEQFSEFTAQARKDGPGCAVNISMSFTGGCNEYFYANQGGSLGCTNSGTGRHSLKINDGGLKNGFVTACTIFLSANQKDRNSDTRLWILKHNHAISWLSRPSQNEVRNMRDGPILLNAETRTTDGIGIASSFTNSLLLVRSLTPAVCSTTDFGFVTPLKEGSCEIQAYT
jgi:hypothetical protein